MEGTTRLETFSDGVFAIAATLLVLEMGVSADRDLGSQLTHIWPSYLAYATSFLTIGIIWMNHHYTVSLLARVDRTFLFVNNLLLMVIAFLPFPTRLVAEHLHRSGAEPATIAYALTFTLMAAMHQVYWQYARRGRRLIAPQVPDAALRGVDLAYIPGVPMYGITLLVAFFSPLTSVLLTFAIAAFYLPSAALFDRRAEPG
ncbi:MAG: TMEM175 family protein [Actinomycetota bacterium]